jgi:hypothetical protein
MLAMGAFILRLEDRNRVGASSDTADSSMRAPNTYHGNLFVHKAIRTITESRYTCSSSLILISFMITQNDIPQTLLKKFGTRDWVWRHGYGGGIVMRNSSPRSLALCALGGLGIHRQNTVAQHRLRAMPAFRMGPRRNGSYTEQGGGY